MHRRARTPARLLNLVQYLHALFPVDVHAHITLTYIFITDENNWPKLHK